MIMYIYTRENLGSNGDTGSFMVYVEASSSRSRNIEVHKIKEFAKIRNERMEHSQ